MTDEQNKPPRRGGRPRVGTVLPTRDGRLQGQGQYADSSRKRLKPFPKGTSEAMARERTAYHGVAGCGGTGLAEIPSTPMIDGWAWLADLARPARARQHLTYAHVRSASVASQADGNCARATPRRGCRTSSPEISDQHLGDGDEDGRGRSRI